MPDRPETLVRQASAALQRGDAAGALALLQQALATSDEAQVHATVGVALRRLGRNEEADASYRRAIELAPQVASTHLNRGLLLLQALGRPADAVASFDAALRCQPDYAAAHFNRGNALHALGRTPEALGAYRAAVAADGRHFEAWMNLAGLLRAADSAAEALNAYERAVALRPQSVPAHEGLAWACRRLHGDEAASAVLQRAVQQIPGSALLQMRRGEALQALGRWEDACAAYERVLGLDPTHVGALNNRAIVLRELGRYDQALASLEAALVLRPELADLHGNRGNVLRDAGRLEEARDSYDHALALDPIAEIWAGEALQAAMELSDWAAWAQRHGAISERIGRGELASTPFALLACCDSASLQRAAAELYAARRHPARARAAPGAAPATGDRIRIGYFSSDLGDHPVGHLMAAVFEHHDRERFEVIAFAHGPQRDDEWNLRIRRAAARYHEVGAIGPEQTAALAQRLDLQIAVDLNGFTRHARPDVFAWRAAPVQVSYLGYVGTMGAPYIDYMIADAVLVPPAQRAGCSESIIRLPQYQANDGWLDLPAPPPRAELGLSEDATVLSCLNSNYKITPTMFGLWMQLLRAAPQAVLWLHAPHPAARRNLRAAAAQDGVDARRLVFAARAPLLQHLRRQAAADLFLDTYPYNAGATASNALRAGVPLLTLAGATPASRMGASLLQALGLDELVTCSLPDYLALAIDLATHPARRQTLRARLQQALCRGALFDAARFTRALEDGLSQAVQRHREGLAPADIDVARAAA